MKLHNFQIFIASFIAVLLVVAFVVWNTFYSHPSSYNIKVKIPKAFNPNFSNSELWDYVKSGNSLPFNEFEKRNIPIPHYDRFLTVSIETNRKIKLNLQEFTDLDDLKPLIDWLKETFQQREEMMVIDEDGKTVKDVIIKAPLSTKYGDVVKVIDAVKLSGADPIILQIDDLSE